MLPSENASAKLHPIDVASWQKNGQKAWCGPSALSALTGMSLASAHSQFAFIGSKAITDVKGTFVQDMLLLLSDAGYNTTPVDLTRWNDTTAGPTLRRFFRELTPMERMQPILVVTETHFLCTHMGFAVDAWTGGKPVPCEEFPKLRRYVEDAYIVTKRHV